MKRSALALFLLLSLPAARADTWTSTDGRTLEGEFVGYDVAEGIITIERTDDRQPIKIPEARLSHPDRLRAVALENNGAEPYWYTDYALAQAENPKRYCLFFYRSGSDPETFELFCHKLLLRERFRKLLDYRYIVVCIQEELPEELMEVYFRRVDGKLVPVEKAPPSPGSPTLICVDFHSELDEYGTRRPGFHKLTFYPGLQSMGNPDPFQNATGAERSFIPLEEVDKIVQKYPRDKFRK